MRASCESVDGTNIAVYIYIYMCVCMKPALTTDNRYCWCSREVGGTRSDAWSEF